MMDQNSSMANSRGANPRKEAPLLASGIINWHLTMLPRAWRPPTDVFETDDRYIVRVEISGMKDGEFSVVIENNILSITGSRAESNERRAYHQMEIHFGEFSTEVEVPANVDVNQIKADYDDGFLWVILPKAQPKRVTIGD